MTERGCDDEALLTVAEMGGADRLTIAAGTAETTLMTAAGSGVARHLQRHWRPAPVLVACGPGNNGGDGYVIADVLAAAGWPVHVAALGAPGKGAAGAMRAAWRGLIEPLTMAALEGAAILVDALFGAGLSRPLAGPAAKFVAAANARRAAGTLAVLAVDMPSGIDGDTGQVRGAALEADETVGFFRAKPGHFLLPGRRLCGRLTIIGIGIEASVLASFQPRQWRNAPALWRAAMPSARLSDHKYRRGHGLIVGGATMTGAARLATAAARRIGLGLASLAVPPMAWPIYALDQPGALVHRLENARSLAALLAARRFDAALIGPGAGADAGLIDQVETVLAAALPTVLDADALTVFAGAADRLAALIQAPAVITPHGGEFSRLFPDLVAEADKLAAARAAARRLGAVVVLKGADTVIADPEGRALINGNAPPSLATGGSGDILAGLICGLLTRGMPPFWAAAAAVWVHGAAAEAWGPGLIAEDLPLAAAKAWAALGDFG
ncbi:MAG: NAD(P)H-hydrate dehydratase [Pseudomonadota bacterium]|nr:NAD(P)H-hydrate dehydratase [Pseudomonadota bacterium]